MDSPSAISAGARAKPKRKGSSRSPAPAKGKRGSRSSSPSKKKSGKASAKAVFKRVHAAQAAISAGGAAPIPSRISKDAAQASQDFLHRVCGALIRASYGRARTQHRSTVDPADVAFVASRLRADGFAGSCDAPCQSVAQAAGQCDAPPKAKTIHHKNGTVSRSESELLQSRRRKYRPDGVKAEGRQRALLAMGATFNPYSASAFRSRASGLIGGRVSQRAVYQICAMAIGCLRQAVRLGVPVKTKTLQRAHLEDGAARMCGAHDTSLGAPAERFAAEVAVRVAKKAKKSTDTSALAKAAQDAAEKRKGKGARRR